MFVIVTIVVVLFCQFSDVMLLLFLSVIVVVVFVNTITQAD